MSGRLIRTATLSDVQIIATLAQASVAELSSGFYTPGQVAGATKYITVPDPQIIEDGTYFIVEEGGVPIACGGWSKRRKLFTGSADQILLEKELLDPGHEPAKLRAMFVHPDHARRGLGRLICQKCEEEAVAAGFTAIELMATLPGVPLYERMGFVAQAKTEMILPDGTPLPGITMRKELAV